jgi:1,2-dihydroxy-3-keto-5-methylthiopentene dioxygenase
MRAFFLDRGADISSEELARNGVLQRRLATEPAAYRALIDQLKADRGYIDEDIVELRSDTPNLAAICGKFVDEHSHSEDEVRFVLQGEGIFDIRSPRDEWMRVVVEAGDLIVVPEGRHHRFLLTESQTIRCVRLFKDKSGWEPHYRAAGAVQGKSAG